ncbi:MAG TPA: hypothetical protein VIO11_09935 [Candidatus Methanoperedens sp.]
MMKAEFQKDESAAIGLPLRISITIIVFSVILLLSWKFMYDFNSDAMERNLMGELDLIDKRAAAMYIHGGARDIGYQDNFSGTLENINIRIPDNAAFIVLGAMPQADGMPPETRETHADNVYYYVLTDGRIQTRSSIARFSANDTNLNKPVVLYPGDHELILELVKNNNGTYVKIEENN